MNVDKSNYVLITGASSGIGFALAEQFAKKGSPLICTARNGEKLNAKAEYLRGRYKVKVEEFTQDLSVDNGAGTLYQKIRNANLDVGIVINNDGFNEAGYFINTDLGREVDLINVHLTAVIELSKLFLQDMLNIKNGGRLVFMASTGAFFPVPNNAVYCVAKMFILNFADALRYELRKTNVKVTVICPGATKTNFPIEAEIHNSRMFNTFPMTPEQVAKISYQTIIKGRRKVICGLYNKLLIALSSITPAIIRNRISDWLYQTVC